MSVIREEFNVHLLNQDGIAAARQVAEIFSDTLTQLEALGIQARERALVVTSLQQAGFWAKRGVAMRPEFQASAEFTGQNAR